jgi:hypothetical protein
MTATDRPDRVPPPTGWKRPFVRFWRRYRWPGVATVGVIALLVITAGIWSVVHPAPTAGSAAAPSDRYTFDVPKTWQFSAHCASFPLDEKRQSADDTCTMPDLQNEAGVYLTAVSLAPAGGETPETVTARLVGQVPGYVSCHGDKLGCLNGATDPGHQGLLRTRVFPTFAIVEICLRTELSGIRPGCDLVWNSIHASG